MIQLYKQIPATVLYLLLAVTYIACGYVIGYHQGYKSGQKDYIIYMNNILENNESNKRK